MDSAFILFFLLLSIRLSQALTPDEYISLRRHNHTSNRDVIRPSPVQIFMHSPKNVKANVLSQPDVIHRRSEKFQSPSSSEYYDHYDDTPALPKKHEAPTKTAFPFAMYDDYYPVRKSSFKTKSHQASPEAKRPKRPMQVPKRPVQVFSENTERAPREHGRNSGGEGFYPRKSMHDIPEANKLPNIEDSSKHRHVHNSDIEQDHRHRHTVTDKRPDHRDHQIITDKRPDHREHQIVTDKRQDYKDGTRAMSASEQVKNLMFRSEEDKLLVAATGYGGKTRAQFHEQGMKGPHSYKFGYNTGDSYNPMARYEERDADGIVRGSYSYVDARGELQVVHYESHPKHGFRTKSGPGSHAY